MDRRRLWVDERAVPAVDDQPVAGAIGHVADPGAADGCERPTLLARDGEADLACVGSLDSDPHRPIVPGQTAFGEVDDREDDEDGDEDSTDAVAHGISFLVGAAPVSSAGTNMSGPVASTNSPVRVISTVDA